MARSFRRRRSDTLGVVLVTLTNSFHAHLLEGAESVAQQHRRTVLVACSHGRSDVERDLVQVFLEKGVDGVIVVPADPALNRDYYNGLIEEGVRLVFVDRESAGVERRREIPLERDECELRGRSQALTPVLFSSPALRSHHAFADPWL